VLEDNRLAAFLAREARSLNLKVLTGALFSSVKTFLTNLEVVENELIPASKLQQPFRAIYLDYLARLDAFRALTFGQIISRAVEALEDPEVLRRVRSPLGHLIVDEYPDVNPAQEALVRALTGKKGVELCVVGDDDQTTRTGRTNHVATWFATS
jgi:DNA helicase II / ATP-dependent DNA helicase PcrA